MKKTHRISAILLSAALLAGCADARSFESELETTVRDSAGGSFALSDLESIAGSAFLVICPYESPDVVEERLGFAWPAAPDYSQADDRQTIAVVDDGHVASATEISRHVIDFCSDGPWELLPVGSDLAVSEAPDPLRVTVLTR